MKDYVKRNEEILKEWRENNKDKYGEKKFAYDGIMYRGKNYDCERSSNKEIENKLWNEARLRILFITKDQPAGDAEAWDVRGELGDLSYAFFRNLMYQLYGLHNTTSKHKADYTFTNEEAEELYSKSAIARINVKKEAGTNSLPNYILRKYLERDGEFLKEQIENLDADIIVCCGYSDSVEDTGNLILNFLIKVCKYKFKRYNDWIYYDKDKKKIAINNWHLSVRKSSEDMYNSLTDAYYQFLKEYPNFIKSHRD